MGKKYPKIKFLVKNKYFWLKFFDFWQIFGQQIIIFYEKIEKIAFFRLWKKQKSRKKSKLMRKKRKWQPWSRYSDTPWGVTISNDCSRNKSEEIHSECHYILAYYLSYLSRNKSEWENPRLRNGEPIWELEPACSTRSSKYKKVISGRLQ